MNELSKLKDWIGSSETICDVATAGPAAGLAALFDYADGTPGPGDPLPPLWHWIYFTPKARQSEIGPDGHPKRGDFLPPVPLPRRMFAGSAATFHRPIRIGEAIEQRSEVTGVEIKEGRSGTLVFVKVHQRVTTPAGLAIEEERDIVYREAAGKETSAPAEGPAAPDFAWRRTVSADAVYLFRYSALTFNGHRIHYDRPYATGVEGYPGLVVHGPLTATLLLELCRAECPDEVIGGYRFRARRPLFDIQPFTVAGGPTEGGATLAAIDPDDRVAMTAEVVFAG